MENRPLPTVSCGLLLTTKEGLKKLGLGGFRVTILQKLYTKNRIATNTKYVDIPHDIDHKVKWGNGNLSVRGD